MILLDHSILFLQWPLLAGIAASMIHVFTGPDHLAAVMPFAVEHRKSSWKIGLFWGIGHLAGMLLIGVLLMLFKQLIPFEAISASSEFLVGFVLIGIGIWTIYRIRKGNKNHQHPHFHEEKDVFHIHSHDHAEEHIHKHQHSTKENRGIIGSFTVGVLHGFAGVAHFILFLPVLSFSSFSQSFGYIAGFGIGTIGAMTSFAVVVGYFAAKSKKGEKQNFYIYFRYTAALFAIVIGVYWIILSA